MGEVTTELSRLAPNLHVNERLDTVAAQLQAVEEEFERTRNEAAGAKERFRVVKAERFKRFNDAFTHISGKIDDIYKELTRSDTFPMGGTASLHTDDSDVCPSLWLVLRDSL